MKITFDVLIKYSGIKAKYHNITNPKKFIDWCVSAYDIEVAFFYDKKGNYRGYWNKRKGLVLK